MGSLDLQVSVNRRADRKTARKEFILAEVLAELAADFVGEIVARRQFGPKAFVVARLHGAQRRGFCGLVGRVLDIAVFPHFAQDKVAPRDGPVVLAHRVVVGRGLGQHGQISGLFHGQI